jgi:hypothetical protein
MRGTRPTFRATYADGFALAGESNGSIGYLRVVCRNSGVVVAGIDIAKSEAGKLGVLIAAMADSLSVSRHFNPTAIPRPKARPAHADSRRYRVRRRGHSAGRG